MAQSRKRNYTSRRERYDKSIRNIRIISIFAFLALLVLIFKNRYDIWAWLSTWFY